MSKYGVYVKFTANPGQRDALVDILLDGAASLTQEETKASIRQAMPLIAGVEATPIRPLGGKGLN